MKFNERLYTLRKNAAMTQSDLAEKLNVSRQAVSRWEMGTAMPDTENLVAMSELFHVSLDYLLKGREFSPGIAADENKEPAATEQAKQGSWLLWPLSAPFIALSLLLYGWLFEKDILCRIGLWTLVASGAVLLILLCVTLIKTMIKRKKE